MMAATNTGTLAAEISFTHCRELARSGWESARSAADTLERSSTPVQLSRIKSVSMAGIYGLRLTQDPGLLNRAKALERFARVLQNSDEQFLRFFSVPSNDERTLVVISDDLERPLAATAVRGTGADPESVSSGAVAFMKASRALEISEKLINAGWRAAGIAAETLTSSLSQDIPLWLATPQTLARHYADRASRDDSSPEAGIDLERFQRAMASRAPSEKIQIFHVFDAYGWQSTIAISGDFTEVLGSVAVKR